MMSIRVRACRRGATRVFGLVAIAAWAGWGCGALRQNLRNEFVSYRGTWECETQGCEEADMKRSTTNHREGEVNVTHVALRPRAIMAFYPGAPVESFTARIRCGAQDFDVPSERVQAPGNHPLQAEPDAWIVVVQPDDYAFSGSCNSYRVVTHATWPDGKSYDEQAGIQVE
jgi:hypothetical protein